MNVNISHSINIPRKCTLTLTCPTHPTPVNMNVNITNSINTPRKCTGTLTCPTPPQLLRHAVCMYKKQPYTSIDPKQRQHFFGVGVNSENSNAGGNECKYTFLKPPAVWELHPRTQSRATQPSHSSGARPRQGQEEDKTRTQSRATEPSHTFQGHVSVASSVFLR